MNDRLSDAFASGALVRPLVEQPDLVHLVRALGTLVGVNGTEPLAATRRLAETIGPAEHLSFILLDGLGMNLLRRLPAGAFLPSHLAGEIRAVCPSTTACALTSVATAQWPAQHGVTGWFTHLPEFKLTATLLPFTERFTHRPLPERDVKLEQALPERPFHGRIGRQTMTFMPFPILNTTYAMYSRGGTPATGYSSIAHAVDQMIDFLRHASGPTYTHLYVPDIDSLCHKKGTRFEGVQSLLEQIDREIGRLAAALERRARLVVSADHGLIDIDPANHNPIYDGDPILDLLLAPPSGDARMPLFHVRPERRGEFLQMFQERFGDRFALLETEESERLELFGPRPMSDVSRRRFGDYQAIAVTPSTLQYHPPLAATEGPRVFYLAQHAGLSPEEMRVPLVVA